MRTLFEGIGVAAAVAVVAILVLRSAALASAQKPTVAPTPAATSTIIPHGQTVPESTPPDVPVPFGYKIQWLAIKGASPEAVIKVLGLDGVTPIGWQDGIDAAYAYPGVDGKYFVSPPVNGWVLVVSALGFPNMGDSDHEDHLIPFVQDLSQRLGCVVQYFGTHRVVEYHAWILAERGKLIRAYGFVGDKGETIADIGVHTPEETKLGLSFSDEHWPNEQNVTDLAGLWSIDPTTLGEDHAKVGTGYFGYCERLMGYSPND